MSFPLSQLSDIDSLDIRLAFAPQTKTVITLFSRQLAGPGDPLTLDEFREKLDAAEFVVTRATLTAWRNDIADDAY